MKDPVRDKYVPIHLIKTKDNEYYVCNNGNHRVAFYKLLYWVDVINHRNNQDSFWLYALVQDEI